MTENQVLTEREVEVMERGLVQIAHDTQRLITSHRLLTQEVEALKRDWQDMYDAHGTIFRRCQCGHMTERDFICNGCGK